MKTKVKVFRHQKIIPKALFKKEYKSESFCIFVETFEMFQLKGHCIFYCLNFK